MGMKPLLHMNTATFTACGKQNADKTDKIKKQRSGEYVNAALPGSFIILKQ
jgi:hypothetical protein